MRVCIAFDSFKDSAGAREIGEAVAAQLAEQFSSAATALACDVLALSDGGEGLLTAASSALSLGSVSCDVTGPLGVPVTAQYALGADGIALVESAQATGLELVPLAMRNPWWTTSFGTGQLLRNAYEKGARRILVGVGGSATNDELVGGEERVEFLTVLSCRAVSNTAGLGALQALGLQILQGSEEEEEGVFSRPVSGCDLQQVRGLSFPPGEPAQCKTLLPGATVEVLADVTTRFAGPDVARLTGGVQTYGPQKGADRKMCEQLDAEMGRIATLLEDLSGVAVSELRGAGAAGGMAGAFAAGLRGNVRRGIEFLAECVGLEDHVRRADLVITGEGRLDYQTLQGKAVSLVVELARRHKVPVVLLCGSSQLPSDLPGLPNVYELVSMFPRAKCMAEPQQCIRALLQKYAAEFPVLRDVCEKT